MCTRKKDFLVAGALAILFVIGAVTPFRELDRTVHQTYCMNIFDVSFTPQPVSEEEIIGANNFSGDIENNFFFNYIAKDYDSINQINAQ